jgi:hypothetical protein
VAEHLPAEVKTEEFVAGKGVVTKWERIRKQNHWFDALYNTRVAGHAAGVRLVDEVQKPAPPPPRRQPEEDDGDRSAWRAFCDGGGEGAMEAMVGSAAAVVVQ